MTSSDAAVPTARRFLQVDVFGSGPFRGNPLAVVVDADGLTDAQMRRIASWTNLSETTFLLPPTRPEADYRVRILTPSSELDFAGHPTLGSAFAWLRSQADGPSARTLVQECPAGLVEVRAEGDRLAFAAPPLVRSGPLEDDHVDAAARALGIEPDRVLDHAWVDNGAGWCVLELASAQDVLALEPDLAAIPGRKIGALGVVGSTDDGSQTAYEVRGFVAPDPTAGTAGYEDPVTGSLNAGIAQWMIERGRLTPPWTARQGMRLGRDGLVLIDSAADAEGQEALWIGGTVRIGITGEVLV